MFNWITSKIIDGYIKRKIKEFKNLDLKKFILDYLKKHKEEIIEKAKEAFEKFINNLLKKIAEKYQDKIEE